jgi:hypothetical protein
MENHVTRFFDTFMGFFKPGETVHGTIPRSPGATSKAITGVDLLRNPLHPKTDQSTPSFWGLAILADGEKLEESNIAAHLSKALLRTLLKFGKQHMNLMTKRGAEEIQPGSCHFYSANDAVQFIVYGLDVCIYAPKTTWEHPSTCFLSSEGASTPGQDRFDMHGDHRDDHRGTRLSLASRESRILMRLGGSCRLVFSRPATASPEPGRLYSLVSRQPLSPVQVVRDATIDDEIDLLIPEDHYLDAMVDDDDEPVNEPSSLPFADPMMIDEVIAQHHHEPERMIDEEHYPESERQSPRDRLTVGNTVDLSRSDFHAPLEGIDRNASFMTLPQYGNDTMHVTHGRFGIARTLRGDAYEFIQITDQGHRECPVSYSLLAHHRLLVIYPTKGPLVFKVTQLPSSCADGFPVMHSIDMSEWPLDVQLALGGDISQLALSNGEDMRKLVMDRHLRLTVSLNELRSILLPPSSSATVVDTSSTTLLTPVHDDGFVFQYDDMDVQ